MRALQRVWGFDALRPMQAAAIRATLDARDALVVLPTGGGKSLCYQLPPLVSGKATVVVSPLIALMRDQVRGLELNGYRAAALHSAVEYEDAQRIEHQVVAGEIDLLLAAPERMVTTGFRTFLARLADADRLGAIAVDEAHCISQWGHDFRPEYRRLAELREVVPGVPMQAYTATATPRVREDIIGQLGLREPEVLVGVFDRPNLTYRVRARQPGARAIEQAAEAIKKHKAAGEGGAIVYCISRKETEDFADGLRGMGLDAQAYHAGLKPNQRDNIEAAFTNEALDVVCATVAFGMGIDRSNVRLVVHAACPKSVEAYQQEAGRAGRDGEPAECLLLYGPGDAGRWTRLIMGEQRFGQPLGESTRAQLELIREAQRFVALMECRHKALSEHFGQDYEPPPGRHNCGACDVCLGETEIEQDSARVAQIIMSAVARLEQRWGASHLVDVLRGASTEKIKSNAHDQLGVYGMLHGHAKGEVQMFVEQLIAVGALQRHASPSEAGGMIETIRFGEHGNAVMKADMPVTLAKPMGSGSLRKERGRRASKAAEVVILDADEKALFERLRAVRLEIAREDSIPPYMVFNDGTLREMARQKPSTEREMLSIKGVGQAKLDAFGRQFLEALEQAGG